MSETTPKDGPEDRRAMPGSLSILQLSQLTGKSREHVTAKLSKLDPEKGVKGAKLYDSADALSAIYGAGSVSPQDALALARVEETKVSTECLRKTRIPLDVIEHVNDEAFRLNAGVLMANQGKVLTLEVIEEMLQNLREIGTKIRNG